MLVVAVISVDANPLLAFSDLTCHLEEVGKVLYGCTVLPDSKETKLENSNQEASLSADKNTGVFLVQKFAHGSCSYPHKKFTYV